VDHGAQVCYLVFGESRGMIHSWRLVSIELRVETQFFRKRAAFSCWRAVDI
jgi:hypothetical protein